jgi:hypothetical protein
MQTVDDQGKNHRTHDVGHLPSPREEPAIKALTHSSLRVTGDREAERNAETSPLTS